MVHNFRESKEEIKDRMIRSALDFWNVKKVENLDPLVRLLMESLAMQLHLISDDIADIEVRTMKRLSEVLLPESYSVARPAHALLYLSPLVEGVSIDLFSDFSLADPFALRNEKAKFSFYPVCCSDLRRAEVRSLIVGGDFYSVLPNLSKKLEARGKASVERAQKLFIGIDFDEDLLDFQSFSLYFDFPNIDRRKQYLGCLSQCRWSCGERQLFVSRGVSKPAGAAEDDGLRLQNISEDVHASVREYYKSNFVTFRDDFRVDREAMSLLPKSFDVKEFGADFEQNEGKPLLWIEVSFPTTFPLPVLKDVQVLLNVVPVVNKELHHEIATVKKNFGVMPLPLSERESFLCMDRVEDESGRVYRRSGWTEDGGESGFYALRQGGCETFDQRDAKDYLLRLQHLLEDEMAMFASSELGRNTENRYLIESLALKIGRVTRRMESDVEPLHYLFVDPPKENTLFYADYWTTFGACANGIRAGLKLNPPTQLFGEVAQAQLVVATSGGEGVPNEQERIERFKFLLASRDRIVTNADIEAFCRAELADSLSEVYVSKGVGRGPHLSDGLLRTIDVHLLLSGVDDLSVSASLADRVYEGLVARSPMTYNYRVLVD